jgi:hypothetical protein
MWERVIKNFKQGATASAEKIEFYAKLGKIKIDVISVKRKMDAFFSELGGEAFTYLASHKNTDLGKNPKIKELIKQIKEQEKVLKAMEKRITELKKETPEVELRRSDDYFEDSPSKAGENKKPGKKTRASK